MTGSMRAFLVPMVAAALGLASSLAVVPVGAQSANPYIVHPELSHPDLPQPWLPPTYQSPRGTIQEVQPVKPITVPHARPRVPPPIVVPETGVALPNMPTISPSGPGGRETYQDRAARCAHQAGAYGLNAGDRNRYIGTCINQ